MALLEELIAALGAEAVRVGQAIPVQHHADWSGMAPVTPLALVLPANTEQVAQAMRICHAHRIAVVPQGGLTGLAGGAVPRADAVALSLSRMNRIETVDTAAATMQVQAGATLQAVQQAAGEQDLQFGVDLGARGSCQIGGNISTNAGGNGVLQFGMMREQVLGLEVVLADGTILPMLRPMLKNNTGYDLKQWFIGAEGTLGIVTRAVLRLRAAPSARATALLGISQYPQVLAVLSLLQRQFPGALAAFELMWDDFFSLSLQWSQMCSPLAGTHPLYVLLDVTGNSAEALAGALQDALANAMEQGLVADAVVAQSETQARTLWRLREAPAEFPSRLEPINFDISLPVARLGEFADDCIQALSARWPAHQSVRFGHIGDSNLHLTTDARTLAGLTRAQAEQQVESLVYGLVEQAGGSISAEHGIGLLKKPFLGASRSPAELAAMQAIKQALDPHNLLNPGKVFDLPGATHEIPHTR